MIRKLQRHIPESTLNKIKQRALVAPIRPCNWWLTVGYQFLESRVNDWGVTAEAGVAKWLCPICGGTYCPVTDLRNRVLTIANMLGLEDSTVPSCVIARLGDFELNQKVEYKDCPNINTQVFMTCFLYTRNLTSVSDVSNLSINIPNIFVDDFDECFHTSLYYIRNTPA